MKKTGYGSLFHRRKVPHVSCFGDAVVVLQAVNEGISELPFTTKSMHYLLEYSEAAANMLLDMPNAFEFLDTVLSIHVFHSGIALSIPITVVLQVPQASCLFRPLNILCKPTVSILPALPSWFAWQEM